jgi:hypothetical protein
MVEVVARLLVETRRRQNPPPLRRQGAGPGRTASRWVRSWVLRFRPACYGLPRPTTASAQASHFPSSTLLPKLRYFILSRRRSSGQRVARIPKYVVAGVVVVVVVVETVV